MNYQEILDFLYNRTAQGIKLNLDRMIDFVERADHPEQHLPGLHIAGTNGKGSTSAISERILREHGWKTGLNTSPHLVDYRERIRLNGTEISVADLGSLIEEWASFIEETGVTFFEISTAFAFLFFAREQVDAAVMEVGLGGRLDASNVWTPTVSIITNVAYDHTKTLGDTLEKIAREKAGIIKPKTPLVLGKMDAIPHAVIEAYAHEQQAPVWQSDRMVQNERMDKDGVVFDFVWPEKNIEWRNLRCNLFGEHQIWNSAAAITATLLLAEMQQKSLNEAQVRSALQQVVWPGRFQKVGDHPDFYVDVAHNSAGMQMLQKILQRYFPQGNLRIITGILGDKSYPQMAEMMVPFGKKFYVSQSQSSRALDKYILAQALREKQALLGYSVPVAVFDSLAEAYRAAMAETTDDETLLVTGSIYTAGEILKEHERNLRE